MFREIFRKFSYHDFNSWSIYFEFPDFQQRRAFPTASSIWVRAITLLLKTSFSSFFETTTALGGSTNAYLHAKLLRQWGSLLFLGNKSTLRELYAKGQKWVVQATLQVFKTLLWTATLLFCKHPGQSFRTRQKWEVRWVDWLLVDWFAMLITNSILFIINLTISRWVH